MMKRLFETADAFIAESTWKDLALLKICLCAMGIMLGLSLPKKVRKPVAFLAMGAFLITYLPLMLKYLGIVLKKQD